MENKLSVIITGATGYVGEGVLLAMLDDERIGKVLSISRRPCGHSHAKLEELVIPDFMDLKEGDPRLEGYDVVFFAAGITSVGTPHDVYDKISHDIPVHVAGILPHKEKTTFIYVSGAGTTDKGPQHWQKVKSSTEHEVAAMGFRHAFGWRPMMMAPYKGQTSKQLKAQKAALVLYPLLRLIRQCNTMPEMCSAIINASLNGYGKLGISPADITRLAKSNK